MFGFHLKERAAAPGGLQGFELQRAGRIGQLVLDVAVSKGFIEYGQEAYPYSIRDGQQVIGRMVVGLDRGMRLWIRTSQQGSVFRS